jgi:hypothetical protein
MKLTIAGRQIALPADAKISIEKSSPMLNSDTGSFSYPFPVPTAPNQQALGWPGKLQRMGEIADQSFLLEDGGLQIFRGEVDYDEVSADEIGVILKSGFTEFYKKMEGKKLKDIDFGSESWPVSSSVGVNIAGIRAKMDEWRLSNDTDNGKYIMTDFVIGLGYGITSHDANPMMHVNKYFHTDGGTGIQFMYNGSGGYNYACFCLQFKVFFVIEKIFEFSGYTITEEMLSQYDFFKKLIIFGNILTLQTHNDEYAVPVLDQLEYSTLMPDIEVLTFLESFQNMFCLVFEIDERKKEVRIKYKKDVFLPENLDGLKIKELAGWMHRETPPRNGFKLSYVTQENALDTYTEYPPVVENVLVLPAATQEGQIVRILSKECDYLTQDTDGVLSWVEVGKLREVVVGDGENALEINAQIPTQMQYKLYYLDNEMTFECPVFKNVKRMSSEVITVMPFFAVSLYHGRKTMTGSLIPYTSPSRYSMDGTIDTGISLTPTYLYNTLHSDFLQWQTYRARPFTKYIELTLPELLALQWGKRYTINGIVIILDKISFELPYAGKVEVEGYTG